MKRISGNRPCLKTERLILRPFEPDDATDVQQLAGNEEVARNTLAMPFPYLDGMAEAWINNQQKEFEEGRAIVFAITLRPSNKLIGAIGLSLQLQYSLAEMGYWIGVPYWNYGYCTEAVKAVINYGFENLKLHKITASHFENNPASGRVMEKAGMFYEGRLISHLFHWNEYKNLIYYGIIEPGFNK